MKRIIKERGTGKTYELVKISAEKQLPIVCVDDTGVLERAKELNVSIPKPIKVRNLGELKGTDYKEVLVDEVDLVLQQLLGININTITITKPLRVTLSDISDLVGRDIGDFEIVE